MVRRGWRSARPRFYQRGSRARVMGRYYGRKVYRSVGGSKGIIKYGAGAVLGYMAPRVHPMQDLIITAAAVVPVRMPYGIKSVAQGYVMGMIVKGFMGGSGTGAGGDFV